MSLRVIAIALAVATAAPAFAQTSATSAVPDVGGAGGGHGAMKACKADRQTYCADVEKGGGRVMQCMKDHADKLSPSCKEALVAMKAQRQGK